MSATIVVIPPYLNDPLAFRRIVAESRLVETIVFQCIPDPSIFDHINITRLESLRRIVIDLEGVKECEKGHACKMRDLIGAIGLTVGVLDAIARIPENPLRVKMQLHISNALLEQSHAEEIMAAVDTSPFVECIFHTNTVRLSNEPIPHKNSNVHKNTVRRWNEPINDAHDSCVVVVDTRLNSSLTLIPHIHEGLPVREFIFECIPDPLVFDGFTQSDLHKLERVVIDMAKAKGCGDHCTLSAIETFARNVEEMISSLDRRHDPVKVCIRNADLSVDVFSDIWKGETFHHVVLDVEFSVISLYAITKYTNAQPPQGVTFYYELDVCEERDVALADVERLENSGNGGVRTLILRAGEGQGYMPLLKFASTEMKHIEGLIMYGDFDDEVDYFDYEALGYVERFAPRLKRIKVHNGGELDEDLMAMLLRNCPNLEYLELQNCETFVGSIVLAIARFCLNLIEIDFGGCRALRRDFLPLLGALPHLRTLGIDRTRDLITVRDPELRASLRGVFIWPDDRALW
jgi:hypothetical protein